jgi:hypothetical protein
VSRWLQTEPQVGNNQLYKNGERESRPHGKINREERGRFCGESHTSKVAEGCLEAAGDRSGVGKKPGLLSEH